MKPGMQHQGIKLGKVYINDVCVDLDLFKKQGQIWSPMGDLQQITIIMTNLCLFEKKMLHLIHFIALSYGCIHVYGHYIEKIVFLEWFGKSQPNFMWSFV